VIHVKKQDWQLKKPLDAILFDCDGTLSSIEGIDELAVSAGPEKAQAVQALTADAMGKTGINPEVYQKRLELVAPARAEVEQLGETYFRHCTPDSKAVISLFQQLGKPVYVLSAGLFEAVSWFANQLNIPPQHVFAVRIQFDEQGAYRDFDKTSPLIHNQGKRIIVEQLKKRHSRLLYLGDGLNDLAVRDLVTRFVGYGGSYYRQNIADQCEFYIKTPSLLPLLPLVLTAEEYDGLSVAERKLYDTGLVMLEA